MEPLLRIDEVAARTGIAQSTLRWWRQSGQGPRSAKFGKRIVYRESDVEAWIDAQFTQAG